MRCKIGIVSIGMLSRALAQEVEYLHLDADFVFSETLMDERDHPSHRVRGCGCTGLQRL